MKITFDWLKDHLKTNLKEKNLLEQLAPPGAIIPKTNTKLEIAKIRGVTSYGMLCSESELNLSDESDGITELSKKYEKNIGKSYFPKSKSNLIDLSITPNRPDCLGVKGIARDLAASGFGRLIASKEKKLKLKSKGSYKN